MALSFAASVCNVLVLQFSRIPCLHFIVKTNKWRSAWYLFGHCFMGYLYRESSVTYVNVTDSSSDRSMTTKMANSMIFLEPYQAWKGDHSSTLSFLKLTNLNASHYISKYLQPSCLLMFLEFLLAQSWRLCTLAANWIKDLSLFYNKKSFPILFQTCIVKSVVDECFLPRGNREPIQCGEGLRYQLVYSQTWLHRTSEPKCGKLLFKFKSQMFRAIFWLSLSIFSSSFTIEISKGHLEKKHPHKSAQGIEISYLRLRKLEADWQQCKLH